MDAVKTRFSLRRPRSMRWRSVLVLLLAASLPLAGCVVFGASAAAALLTGLFVGRLQASLAATARSYQFSETGNVGLVFAAPQPATVSLVRFVGRLPAFHVVFVNLKQTDSRQAQATGDGETQAALYDTDVEIDFTTSPPSIVGFARAREGGDTISLDELYSEISGPFAEVTGPNAAGAWTLRISLSARSESGDELDYALVLRLQPSAGQSRLEGSADIERTFTPAEGEPETITGSGSVDTRRMPDSALPDINDNADEPDNDNENDNTAGNVNDNQDDGQPPPGSPASACFPGLSVFAAGAVDLFVSYGGREALDLNADGEVTTGEVQDAINPVLNPYGYSVSAESAACIAELVTD